MKRGRAFAAGSPRRRARGGIRPVLEVRPARVGDLDLLRSDLRARPAQRGGSSTNRGRPNGGTGRGSSASRSDSAARAAADRPARSEGTAMVVQQPASPSSWSICRSSNARQRGASIASIIHPQAGVRPAAGSTSACVRASTPHARHGAGDRAPARGTRHLASMSTSSGRTRARRSPRQRDTLRTGEISSHSRSMQRRLVNGDLGSPARRSSPAPPVVHRRGTPY